MTSLIGKGGCERFLRFRCHDEMKVYGIGLSLPSVYFRFQVGYPAGSSIPHKTYSSGIHYASNSVTNKGDGENAISSMG